jgi:hypothetical protein
MVPASHEGRVMRIGRTRSIPVPAGLPAGVLATVGMDAAMVAASVIGGRAFTSERTDIDVIGRWVAGLLHGRLCSDDIANEPPVRGEVALGLVVHYATGVILTQTFLLLPRRGDGRPTFLGGTAYGFATSVLPLLVMFPSMGYGWMALRSGEAARVNRIMLVGHTAFGIGIGLWAPRFAARASR